LDEIEALPLSQQVKLLRFLESGEVRRVGAKNTIQVQTRVIVASNQSLKKLVAEGKFREDLYFRLNGQRIELPPLRERTEDIPELAKTFLEAERPRRNKEFSEDGLAALKEYRWPGNVRELKRVCEQVSLLAPLPFIRQQDVRALLEPTPATSDTEEVDLSRGLNELVAEFESKIIRSCMKKYDDVEELAKFLKVSRSNLYKKIKDFKLDEETP
jgi:DNA-binding NtrC family response regulator